MSTDPKVVADRLRAIRDGSTALQTLEASSREPATSALLHRVRLALETLDEESSMALATLDTLLRVAKADGVLVRDGVTITTDQITEYAEEMLRLRRRSPVKAGTA